jgi:hypothetical protein
MIQLKSAGIAAAIALAGCQVQSDRLPSRTIERNDYREGPAFQGGLGYFEDASLHANFDLQEAPMASGGRASGGAMGSGGHSPGSGGRGSGGAMGSGGTRIDGVGGGTGGTRHATDVIEGEH